MKKEEEKSVSYDNGVVCGLIRRGMYKSNFASRGNPRIHRFMIFEKC